MVLLDVYSPTQGVNFIELRAITNDRAMVTATLRVRSGAASRTVQQKDLHHTGAQETECLGKKPSAGAAGSSASHRSSNPLNCACDMLHFWKVRFDYLEPGTPYVVDVRQANGAIASVDVCTAARPRGRKLFRFGILSDMHVNTKTEVSKRKPLMAHANELAEEYIARMGDLGAEFIVMPGDLCDTWWQRDLNTAKKIVDQAPVPCMPVVGNHEEPGAFTRTFGLEMPYYSFDRNGVHFILLETTSPASLEPGSPQYEFLVSELEMHAHSQDTIVFTHYSMVTHPFFTDSETQRDTEGTERLAYGEHLAELLASYPRVRAVFSGHKNIPSCRVYKGVGHILCAQLVQAPCGYDVVDVYEGGLVRMVYQIDEQDLLMKARAACGEVAWKERCRSDAERNCVLHYAAEGCLPPSAQSGRGAISATSRRNSCQSDDSRYD